MPEPPAPPWAPPPPPVFAEPDWVAAPPPPVPPAPDCVLGAGLGQAFPPPPPPTAVTGAPGNKVEFYCQELNLTVGGSPDLMYNGIPVETKTTSKLPKRKKKNKLTRSDQKRP